MRLLARFFEQRSRNRRRGKPSGAAGVVDLLESRVLLTAVNIADEEQLILELINRSRANPEAEAARLGISLNAGLPAGTITSTPKQPLAPNQQLQNASVAHSVDMINRDFFAHTNPSGITPGGRATAAGYNWWTIAENIAYIGYFGGVDINANSREAHDLLFRSAGHRENILMDEVEEIGIGIRSGAYAPAGSNATLVTENFGRRSLNPIITGVVYSDTNNSDFYDIGEAVRSGTITARRVSDGATFTDGLGTSGGYGLIVPAGSYVVTAAFTRNGVPVTMSSNVTVVSDNVKVDFDATAAVAIELSLSASTVTMWETGRVSTIQFTVTRSGATAGPLTVNLSSSDTTEITVPAGIVIPDGQASVNFTVTAVDDGMIDGPQNALVQASATSAVSVSRSVRVNEGTSPQFPLSAITTATSRPVFSWNSVTNAATYEIQIMPTGTGSPVFIQQAGLVSNTFQMPTDLPLGDFSIRVRAITATGLNSIWSAPQLCRSRPVTTIEGSRRTESSGNFTIRWAAVAGATKYDVLVDNMTTRTPGFLRDTEVLTASLDVRDFQIGRYQVRVRATGAPGQLSGWSVPAIITVSLRATGVRVSAAAIGSLTTLNWDPVPGAARYEVQVDNLTTGVLRFIRNTNVPGTSLEMPTLTPGSYAAYVKAIDASGVTHLSSVASMFQFNTASRLSFVTTDVQGRPLLSWRTVAGAVRYELVFLHTVSGERITLSALTGNQFRPENPLSAGTWRAWIRAIDSQGSMTGVSNAPAISVASSKRSQPEATSLLLASVEYTLSDASEALTSMAEIQASSSIAVIDNGSQVELQAPNMIDGDQSTHCESENAADRPADDAVQRV